MSIVQALICGIIYWLAEANLPFVGLWTLQRPLVCGFLTGCVLGTLLLTMVTNSLILLGVNVYWQRAFIGAIIIIGTAITVMQSNGGLRALFGIAKKEA